MAVTSKPRPAHLRRELHIWEAIGLSVAGASPALAMAFSGPGVAALVGRAAALSFLFAAVTCIFIGYAFMLLARRYNSAGSVYGFVGASLGPRSGFFAGWAMMLMYFVFTPGSAAAAQRRLHQPRPRVLPAAVAGHQARPSGPGAPARL
jgi:amino acid transporter